MRKLLSTLAARVMVWLLRSSAVARCGSIVLADLRNKENQTEHFQKTLIAALLLLERTDARRFGRVQKHIAWIANTTLARGGAEYHHRERACFVEFVEPSPVYDLEYLTGWYACTLIHEATHGVLRSRGLPYTPELRERIERLCVREEQRFVRRLASIEPELATRIVIQFDPQDWHWHWNASRLEELVSRLARSFNR